jgi:hypothetical protein
MESSPSEEQAKNAIAWTQEIIDQCGPRITSDASTRQAAGLIEDRFKTYSSQVRTESFNVYPKSFLGWIRIFVVFYILSVIGFWINVPCNFSCMSPR